VEALAERVAVLAFDGAAAAHAGDIRADLQRRGSVIGAYDVQIAGHARSQGLVVITADLVDFRRVEGLRAEDWLAG
jgi:tRNA(fMet)-specific endonuclease VapC